MSIPSGEDRGSCAGYRTGEDSGADSRGIIERGYSQFLCDLPGLLRNPRKRAMLAAYHGERRICVAYTMRAVEKECARQSVPLEEVMIESIQLQPDASHHVFDSVSEADAQGDVDYTSVDAVAIV